MAANASATAGVVNFWSTYGPVITGGAIIISALCAFTVILVNRGIARRRATLDLILHVESDGDLISARKIFVAVKDSSTRSRTYGTREQRDSDEANAIRTVLNIYELIGVSIGEGLIDERLYRRWFNKAFITDYEAMTGYIESVRAYKQNPALFREMEALATKWKNDATWYQKPGWWRRKGLAIKRIWQA